MPIVQNHSALPPAVRTKKRERSIEGSIAGRVDDTPLRTMPRLAKLNRKQWTHSKGTAYRMLVGTRGHRPSNLTRSLFPRLAARKVRTSAKPHKEGRSVGKFPTLMSAVSARKSEKHYDPINRTTLEPYRPKRCVAGSGEAKTV